MNKLILLMASMISFSAFAGDNGGGSIECKSGSGRTLVSGGAGAAYNGMGAPYLTYSIDGSAVSFATGATKAGGLIVDYAVYEHKKMYAVGFKRTTSFVTRSGEVNVYSEDVFQMRSVTGSFREVRADVFAFKAVIPAYTSLDPRHGSDMNKETLERFDKDIEVNCVLDVTL